jgi:hypothetical protein
MHDTNADCLAFFATDSPFAGQGCAIAFAGSLNQ